MTKKWITTPSDRASAKYKAQHLQLRRELYKPELEPDKVGRKRAASQSFRQTGANNG